MSANNAQQSSGLSARTPRFDPSGPATDRGTPDRGVNVESISQSTVVVAQGGYMMNGVFITTRGDHMDVVPFMEVQGQVLIQLFKRWVNSRSAVLSRTPLKPVEDC